MSSQASRFRFGPFVVERAAYRVLKDGSPIILTPKLVDVLLHLVSRPSLLVTKEELLSAIWPDVAVTDNAVTQAISDLRQALGDDAASPRYIQTVARRGYRFIAAVEHLTLSDTGERAEDVVAVLPRDAGAVRSVAVLSFANVSNDPDLDWLSTGIAETVTNDLTAFRVLRVVDRGRVAEAARRTDGSLSAVTRDLGVPLAVVGSFQRVGGHLRITARLVDVPSGATMADAKVDGRMEDVFDLQDRIVRQFSAMLGVETAYGSSTRVGVRETSSLYHVEFTMNAHDGRGFASLASRQPDVGAEAFTRALRLMPGHARSHLGLAACHLASGQKADAQRELEHAERSIAELARAGRHLEAALLAAMAAVVRGRPTDAISTLDRLLTEAPPGYPGWTIPIEPLLKPLQAQPEFGPLLAKLKERAR